MINQAIEYIRKETANFLNVNDNEVLTSGVQDLKADKHGLYLMLVNVEEESSLKNTSHSIQKNQKILYQEPPVFLNLFLLFAANFSQYATSLQRISQVVELFQSKRFFDKSNERLANPFPISLEKLIFDFSNLNFEELNHLWGILGGEYRPSVLYKVRLVRVQHTQTTSGPEIKEIQVELTP